jgi:hypothetical protein
MDKLSDPAHPVWKIIRLVVVGVIIGIYCATQYKNGFDAKDVGLILSALLGVGGFDQAKALVTKAYQ